MKNDEKKINVKDLSKEDLKAILGSAYSVTCPECGGSNILGTLTFPPVYLCECGCKWVGEGEGQEPCLQCTTCKLGGSCQAGSK